MSQDNFSDRADALENAFFAQVDAKLMEKLQASLEKQKAAEDLAAVTGIADKHALEALAEAGVDGKSMVALHVFPLVAVAWADNVIQSQEREKILDAARENGMASESPAGVLLNEWLTSKPSDRVFTAWEAYAQSLVNRLDPEAADALRNSIESEVRGVAQSAGGVLGWAAVSQGESQAMKRITTALQKRR